ncbi:hypothetical protein [Streptomyces sp. NPDC087300]|uniref:hypothetical protein n=1 Tax=Streptomyces sp. NPDC087300 TaxID=3365780 RepID=UPI00382AC214
METWIPVVASCVAATAALFAALMTRRTQLDIHRRTRASDLEDRAREERAEARKEWVPFLSKADALALAVREYAETGRRVSASRPLGTGTNLPDPLGKAMAEFVEARARGELAGPAGLASRAEELSARCVEAADAAVGLAFYQDGTPRDAEDYFPPEELDEFERARGEFRAAHQRLRDARQRFVEEANRSVGIGRAVRD